MKKLPKLFLISLIVLLMYSSFSFAFTVGEPPALITPSFEAYAPDPSAADQGASDTTAVTLKNLIDAIGTSLKATIILHHNGAGNTTTYTLTTSETLPANISIYFEWGAILDGAGTLTCAGGPHQIIAGPGQNIFGTSITVVAGTGSPVWCNWWGTTAAALQSAIDSTGDSNFGAHVKISSEIDITTSTVTLKQGTIVEGIGVKYSGIAMNGGSISFGTYYSGSKRLKVLRDLYIANAAATGNTVDLGVINGSNHGPYENLIENCEISGGLNAINLDGAVWTTIKNSMINNNAAARYAIYASGTSYVNQLTLTDSRINGMVYLDLGSSGRTLDIKGTIFEGSNSPMVNIVATLGGDIHGSYFESSANGIRLLDIDSTAHGLSIAGNFFDVAQNTDEHIYVDGDNITVEDNYFGTIGSQNVITLQSNSALCKIGTNKDAGGGNATVKVSDSGSYNQVWGASREYFIAVTEMHSYDVNGAAINAYVNNDGLPYVSWGGGAATEYTIEYLFKIPPEAIPSNAADEVQFTAYLLYRASSAHGGDDWVVRSNRAVFTVDDSAPAATSNTITETEPAQTLTKSAALFSNTTATGEDFIQIEVGRSANAQGADTYADAVYVYGVYISLTAVAR